MGQVPCISCICAVFFLGIIFRKEISSQHGVRYGILPNVFLMPFRMISQVRLRDFGYLMNGIILGMGVGGGLKKSDVVDSVAIFPERGIVITLSGINRSPGEEKERSEKGSGTEEIGERSDER